MDEKLISIQDYKLSKLIAENHALEKTRLHLIRAVFLHITDDRLEEIADDVMLLLYNHFRTELSE